MYVYVLRVTSATSTLLLEGSRFKSRAGASLWLTYLCDVRQDSLTPVQRTETPFLQPPRAFKTTNMETTD